MRLTHPNIQPAGQPITFQFDGQTIKALEGETISAALSAAGITTFRHTPSGAPRGAFCGMGACYDCVVTVDGHPGQRACMTPAADGITVTSTPPETLAVPPTTAAAAEERSCDILVVGGGIAGLSAGIAAARAGASVVVLDERQAPGGE